jgi:hypothetical protein
MRSETIAHQVWRQVLHISSSYDRSSEARPIYHKRLGSLVITPVTITATVCFAQEHPDGSPLPIETAQSVPLAVVPKLDSPIAMKVFSEAMCVRHDESASDAEHSLETGLEVHSTCPF